MVEKNSQHSTGERYQYACYIFRGAKKAMLEYLGYKDPEVGVVVEFIRRAKEKPFLMKGIGYQASKIRRAEFIDRKKQVMFENSSLDERKAGRKAQADLNLFYEDRSVKAPPHIKEIEALLFQ